MDDDNNNDNDNNDNDNNDIDGHNHSSCDNDRTDFTKFILKLHF